MPQLVPFYYVTSLISIILGLTVLLFVLSRFVLPLLPRIQVIRMFVTML